MSKYLKSGWDLAGGIKVVRKSTDALASKTINETYPMAKSRVRLGMNTRLKSPGIAKAAGVGAAGGAAGLTVGYKKGYRRRMKDERRKKGGK